MKKAIIATALLVFAFSCKNRNEDLENLQKSAAKIDSVKIPADTMSLGSTAVVTTYSTLHTGCENFYKYSYSGNDLTRQIVAIKTKNNAACGQTSAVASTFSFSPKSTGSYTLKFWTGPETNTYGIEKKIVVR